MGKTVLLADDNYLTVEGLRTSIDWASLGIDNVRYVYDGETAIELIRKEKVDLIISDISMPGLSGLELSEKVMELNPSIKIILISAYDEFEYARKAVHIGAYDYIEKPLNYEALTETIAKALAEIDDEQKNREILRRSRPAMEESFFRMLISQASMTSESIGEYLEYFEWKADCNSYMVFQIRIENSEELRRKTGLEEYAVRVMNLEHSLSALCETFPLHYFLKDYSSFICILGMYTGSTQEMKNAVNAVLEEISEQFSGRFDLIIGLGSVEHSLQKLHDSYLQSEKALGCRFFFPERTILEAVSFSTDRNQISWMEQADEEELIHLISRNDRQGVHAWINEFISMFSSRNSNRAMVMTAFYSVATRLLKFCYEMNVNTEETEKEAKDVFSGSEHFQTITEISDWLNHFCLQICESLQQSLTSYHQAICRSAVAYIEKNYRNSDLNLNRIAEEVQIAPSYLSTLFKKYMQQNISTYITNVRIEAACLLLRTSNMSLKEISDETGYANQYYFSTSFKKKMGMPPTQYRET